MNIKKNIFRFGSIYKKLSRPINAINHLPPLPQYAKCGWCAAMTLRQYLVCRECRKVAQHRARLSYTENKRNISPWRGKSKRKQTSKFEVF
jgi:hypothetical protein